MCHGKAPDHKENCGHKGWPLEIGYPHNGMAGSTSAGVPRAKTDQKSTHHKEDKSGESE